MQGEVIRVPFADDSHISGKKKPIECVMRSVFADNRDMSISLTLEGVDVAEHNHILDHARILMNRQGALSDLPLIEAEIEKHQKALGDQRRDMEKANADQDKKIAAVIEQLREAAEDQGKTYDRLKGEFDNRPRKSNDMREFDPEAPRVKSALEAPSKRCAELQEQLDKLGAEKAAAEEGIANNVALFEAALAKLMVRREKALTLIGE